MQHSICRFAPAIDAPDVIQIIHFVYETSMGNCVQNRLETTYKLGLVVSGSATLTCYGKKEDLHPGELFFAFPAVPYVLEGQEAFTYHYISFVGLRANMLLDQLKISPDCFVFRGLESLLPLWMDAICSAEAFPELAAEAVILYTLMKLGNTLHIKDRQEISRTAETMLLIKREIDDSFSSADLSVDVLAKQFGYHRKYISSAFKKFFKVGIREYITQLRINQACLLMEQGYTSVKDIAALSGYSDAMYFSKVFCKKMGMPPREYMKSQKTP